ncbi:hypothetical protein NMG60_11003255 [Bertholletia excelsa]
MSEEGKDHLYHHHRYQQEQPPQYGTFQGVANFPPQPAIGFPQPAPPPGAVDPYSAPPPPSQYYAPSYQAVPGYAVVEGRPVVVGVRERRLPCCGIGYGWFLFIGGFFLAIPWYVGAVILLCIRSVDHREKPGYIACTVAAVLATIALLFGMTNDDWLD